jgi:hypothetical protein
MSEVVRVETTATEDDIALTATYAGWPEKGPPEDGQRLTIMSRKDGYTPGEEVRVVHVREVSTPGRDLYVMGPKPVSGEYVDGFLQGRASSDDPFAPAEYDGRVVGSPGIDDNFEVTAYRFTGSGRHEICWRPGRSRSNTLTIWVRD